MGPKWKSGLEFKGENFEMRGGLPATRPNAVWAFTLSAKLEGNLDWPHLYLPGGRYRGFAARKSTAWLFSPRPGLFLPFFGYFHVPRRRVHQVEKGMGTATGQELKSGPEMAQTNYSENTKTA
jgi:hypothetical protein